MSRDLEDLGTDASFSPEEDAGVRQMIAQADRDIEERRVGFRWGAAPLAVIQRAAALYGVPYQTYVKQVAFRQALTDLRDAALVNKADESVDAARE